MFTQTCLIIALLKTAICDKRFDFKVTDDNCHAAKRSAIVNQTTWEKREIIYD